MRGFKSLALVASVGAGSYLIAQLSLLAVSVARGAQHAKGARRFQRGALTDASDRARVLVIGDSTGVGVGAGDPSWSMAGLLSRDFEDAIVENRSVSGARIADVLDEWRRHEAQLTDDVHYDLVLLHIGGNDVLRRFSMDGAMADADVLLEALKRRASHIVWFGSANVGRSRVFLPPFGLLLTARMRTAHRLFRAIADRHGVTFLDYFREAGCDPYSARPRRYYASDGLHPSRAAYRYCYQVLRRRVPLGRWIGKGLSSPVVVGAASRLMSR